MMLNEIIVQGNPNIPNIALTFDDGPGRVTPYILDVLLKYGAKATFFCLGYCIDKNIVAQDHTGKYTSGSEIVKRADEEGHLIAIHSYDHLALPRLTDEEILNNELSRTKNKIINLIKNNHKLINKITLRNSQRVNFIYFFSFFEGAKFD